MKASKVAILAVVAIGLATLAWFVKEKRETSSVALTDVYPGMLEKINSVKTIEAVYKGQPMTLNFSDGQWLMVERNNYRASTEQVKKFLRGFAEMRRLEPKTSDPAKYVQLDLDDPKSADSEAFGLVLKDGAGIVLADVIMGKDRSATADSDMREVYLRQAGEAETWLVESDIRILRKQIQWLEKIIMAMHRDRIEQIFIDHEGSDDDVMIKRESLANPDFVLSDIPEGKEITYNFELKDIATAFASLDFDDVIVDEGVDYDGPGSVRITLDSFDGMRVVTLIGTKDGGRWARLMAAESGRHSAKGEDGSDKLLDAKQLADEIELSNKHWKGWAYKIRGFKLENITQKKVALLKNADEQTSGAQTQ